VLNWCERKALLAGNQPAEQGQTLLYISALVISALVRAYTLDALNFLHGCVEK
jgi:hypothetical protein